VIETICIGNNCAQISGILRFVKLAMFFSNFISYYIITIIIICIKIIVSYINVTAFICSFRIHPPPAQRRRMRGLDYLISMF
jgi:hypothetical protein